MKYLLPALLLSVILTGCGDITWFPNILPLSVVTSSLPGGTVGVPYSAILAAKDGDTPYTWTATGLPAGLSIVGNVITGTPTVAGTSTVTLKVTDKLGATATSGSLSVVINPALSVTTTSLPGGAIGAAYTGTLAATGGTAPYTWSVMSGSLPSGLSLNASSGAITGAPTTIGTSNIVFKVTDSAGSTAVSGTLSIVISVVAITTTSPLPSATVNSSYTQTLAAAGGTTPYTWSLTAGSTPPVGLTLSPTGIISGTPTAAGTTTFSVTVTDSSTTPQTATQSLSLTITQVALAPAAGALRGTLIKVNYLQYLNATGGTLPYAWSLDSGSSLPTGFTLNPTLGYIQGLPPAGSAGTSSFTVKVTDGVGKTATQTYNLTVTDTTFAVVPNLPDAPTGIAYSQNAVAGGTSPYSYSPGTSAPSWFHFQTDSGLVTATQAEVTSSATGVFTYTPTATDASHSVSNVPVTIVVPTSGKMYDSTQKVYGDSINPSYDASTNKFTVSITFGNDDTVSHNIKVHVGAYNSDNGGEMTASDYVVTTASAIPAATTGSGSGVFPAPSGDTTSSKATTKWRIRKVEITP